MTLLNLDRPLQTRSGLKARFVGNATGGQLAFAIGYLGGEAIEFRYADGRKYGRTKVGQVSILQSADDVINTVVERVTFFNVYANGTIGKTPHAKLDHAKARAKVGLLRVGILEQFSEDGTVTATRYHPCAPTTRTSGYDFATFPTAASFPLVRAAVAEQNA